MLAALASPKRTQKISTLIYSLRSLSEFIWMSRFVYYRQEWTRYSGRIELGMKSFYYCAKSSVKEKGAERSYQKIIWNTDHDSLISYKRDYPWGMKGYGWQWQKEHESSDAFIYLYLIAFTHWLEFRWQCRQFLFSRTKILAMGLAPHGWVSGSPHNGFKKLSTIWPQA